MYLEKETNTTQPHETKRKLSYPIKIINIFLKITAFFVQLLL